MHLCSFVCLIIYRIVQTKQDYDRDVGMGKYERVSAGTVSILLRITLRLIIRGLAPDLTPGRLKEW